MTDIIKTQQGLARKAEGNRTHRFEDLYHVICKREWIETALQHVLDNDGAGTAGVDGISWKDFNDAEKSDVENERFREQFIQTLQTEFKATNVQTHAREAGRNTQARDEQEKAARYPHVKGPDGANLAQDAHGTYLGGRFLLLLEWVSAWTVYNGLYPASVFALQHQYWLPMGDRR